MEGFKKYSTGKRILAIALSVMIAVMSIPVNAVLRAFATEVAGSVNVIFAFAVEGHEDAVEVLEGAKVKATRTDVAEAESEPVDISNAQAEMAVVPGGEYKLSVLIGETEVAVGNAEIPAAEEAQTEETQTEETQTEEAQTEESQPDDAQNEDAQNEDAQPEEAQKITVNLTVSAPTVSVSAAEVVFGDLAAKLEAKAVGLGDLSYQWYEGSVAAENACGTNSAECVISEPEKLVPGNPGVEYFCVVTSDLVKTTGSGSAVLTVNKRAPHIQLTASPDNSKNVTLTATVSGVKVGETSYSPKGSVLIFDSEINLTPVTLDTSSELSLTATVDVTDLAPGAHTFKAQYVASEDAYFTDSAVFELSYDVNTEDQQDGFAFEQATVEKTYYKGFEISDVKVNDPKSENGNEVTYSISPAVEGVSIDAGNGKVSIGENGKAGTYNITATKAAGNGFAKADATYTLVVNKAVPVITKPDQPTITYGEKLGNTKLAGGNAVENENSNPAVEIEGSFAFAGEEKDKVPAVEDSNETEYKVIFTPTLIDLYATAETVSTVTVNRKELTATAKSVEITYNADPSFEVSVEGFVNGDAEDSLAGYKKPTASIDNNVCEHGNRSASGVYENAIKPAGGIPTDNYYFTYVTGDLTVKNADIIDDDYTASEPENGKEGWFNKEDIDKGNSFVIKPSESAPRDFDKISTLPDGSNAADELTYNGETAQDTVTFYLVNSKTGAVSNSKELSYRIDKTAPTVDVQYATGEDSVGFIKKIANFLTFGLFFKESATVTVSGVDSTSGIAKYQYMTVDMNGEKSEWTDFDPESGNVVEIKADFAGKVIGRAIDKAGNISNGVTYRSLDENGDPIEVPIVVNDDVTNAPKITISTENGYNPNEGTGWTNEDVTITLSEADEAKKAVPGINIYQYRIGADGTWTDMPFSDEKQEHEDIETKWIKNKLVLNADTNETFYFRAVSNTGVEGNESSVTIRIQKTLPKNASVGVDPEAPDGNDGWYQSIPTISVEKPTKEKDTFADITTYFKLWSSKEEEPPTGTVFSADSESDKPVIKQDGVYQLRVWTVDEAGNACESEYSLEIKVDTTAPTEPKITYSKSVTEKMLEGISFGFYRAPVTVTVEASDATSEMNHIDWKITGTKGRNNDKDVIAYDTLEGASGTFTISPQFIGYVSAVAVDNAGNSTEKDESKPNEGEPVKKVVVDSVAPGVEIKYEGNVKNDNDRYYYTGKIVGTITVTEDNFFVRSDKKAHDDNDEYAFSFNVERKDDNDQVTTYLSSDALTWTQINGNKFEAKFELTADGDYTVTAEYDDYSENYSHPAEAEAEEDEAAAENNGETNETTAENEANEEQTGAKWTYSNDKLTLDNTKPVVSVTYSGGNYEDEAGIAGYHGKNSATEDETITAKITVNEHNFDAEKINFAIEAKDIEDKAIELTNEITWTKTAQNVYTASITYSVDANYKFSDLKCFDYAGNESDYERVDTFTLDNTAPEIKEIRYNKTFLATVFETLTFGFFQAPVTVTLTATDETSGVKFFNWKYEGTKGEYDTTPVSVRAEQGGSDQERTASSNTFTAQFEITDKNQFKGVVSATAIDNSNNTSGEEKTASDKEGTESGGIVVDNTKPEIEVLYNPEAPAQETENIDYYNSDITATLRITEENFYAEDVKVVLEAKNKDGDIIPSIDVAAIGTNLTKEDAWTHSGTVHEATVILSQEAYYNFTVAYTDKSENEMETYVSRTMCLDKTAPSNLEIQYNNNPFRAFLNLATFNLFENKVDVTIKAVDENAAIQYIEWQYAGVAGTDNSTKVDVSATTEQKTAVRKDGTHEYTVKFTVSEQFKGEIRATAVDFATNRSAQDPAVDAIELVDTKDPVITVTYPNDAVPAVFNGADYYKADRTARIEIVEDNFVDATTQIVITKDGQPYTAFTPAQWTVNESSHVKEIVFNEDGDYTLEVLCKDIVGREAKVVEKPFTVDKTLPVFEVVYNNNDVRNGNYYKEERTATITITEHNFNIPDVHISVSATDDGNILTAPNVSEWRTEGDVHTATINYSDDALYTFGFEYTDLAGNAAAPFTTEEFYVDKTAPEIAIENIDDLAAYGEIVQPLLKLTDINYGGDYSVTLRRTDINADSSDFFGKLNKTVTNNADGKGVTINFADIPTELENDGIYNLSINLVDKAGNETVKNITFSVNRFGSTYYYADEATKNLADQNSGKLYINQEINIKIGEINVDPLVNSAVTVSRNNDVVNELNAGADYTVVSDSEPGGWYSCVYDIKAANFADEGFYTVIVTSTDTAEHTSKNTIPVAKGNELPVEFTVDKTVPSLVIKDIESGVAYSEAERKVTIEGTDVNLNPETLKVYLDGKEIEIDKQQLVVDQFGKLSVELLIKENEGKAQTLEAKVSDLADNETETSVKRFTLSANVFQLWFQNKPLFIGSIVGVVGLSAGLVILLRKRKKNAEA